MKYIHGLERLPLMEIDEEGNERINIMDGLGVVGIKSTGESNYLLKDHLGSTRVVIGEGGEKVGEFDYKDFGETKETAEAGKDLSGIKYRYTGQEWDEELQQYNYLAREYDPRVGRFDSIDPAREGFSPYAYVGNNPINFEDPNGEELKQTNKKDLRVPRGEKGKVTFYEDTTTKAGSFSLEEQELLTSSLEYSLKATEANINMLSSKDPEILESIDIYFGKGHDSEKIKSGLKSIYYGLQNESFLKVDKMKRTMMRSAPGKANVPIDVNVDYLKLPETEVAGNIIHEASHKYLSAADHKVGKMMFKETAYGETNVKKLAKADSTKGIENADSWNHFIRKNFRG